MELYQELQSPKGIIRGMLTKPDINEPVPLVVMFHGFTGNRVDSKFMLVSFSRFLASHNIASLRFDFIGSGESDGEFRDMTFLNEVKEANLILDYAKQLKDFSNITAMGFSMGGAIASFIAPNRMSDIDQLLLWSPAGNIKDIARFCFENNTVLDSGNVDLTGLELSRKFYDELITLDVYADIEGFTKPVGIIHGSNDQGVPLSYGEQYHRLYKNSEFHVIKDADHVYSSLAFRKELFEKSLLFITSHSK